ncbi:MAG TPA: PAS domain-containing protein, partial [Methanomicrobiales archaeon]|nr:PAS domain-containing protein [Methanomicrobiales archaeon]
RSQRGYRMDVKLAKEGMRAGLPVLRKGTGRHGITRREVRKGEIDSRIRQVLLDHPRGLTAGEIGRAISLNRSSTARHLGGLSLRGDVEIRRYGKTRVFSLPKRANLSSALADPRPLVLLLSGDLTVTGVNDPFLAYFGFRREDLVGKRLGNTPFASLAGERLLGEIRKGMHGGAGPLEFECLVGNIRYVFRASVTPLATRQGPAGVVLSFEDVTRTALERRRLEELADAGTLGVLTTRPRIVEEILERRRREERMELIQRSVDQGAVPALWVGRDGGLIGGNRAAAALLGYGEEELARMSVFDLDPDHPPGDWDALWQSLKARAATTYEGRLLTRSGEPVRVAVRASHLAHRDQEFGFLLFEKIPGPREDGGALRAAGETLRAFLDANPDPSFLVDTGGRILVANRAAATLLGPGPGADAGASIFDAMPEKVDRAREVFGEVLATGEPRVFAEEIRGRFYSTTLSPIPDPSGKVGRVAIFARDFTEGKQVEEALRKANGKLNLLTAITRHDALNDIAALGMYLALPGGNGNGDGDHGDTLPTGKLAALLRGLQRRMEFTRDYANLGLKAPGWEDVGEAVMKGVRELDTRGLRVELDLPPLEIRADPLFPKAIANLVDNTIRHGGHATRIRFRARVEDGKCTIIVDDDGVGIPSEAKELIFRPGYGRHTGLGLFLIREILGITGIGIAEDGEPGKGARFEIRIPADAYRLRTEPGDAPAEAVG